MRGLIEAYVREEIYYREALTLGLDRDDTLIRRRMQQKMEFLSEPGDDQLAASDAELEAFYEANQADFRVEPKVEFQQIFIDPKKGDEPAAVRAERVLGELRAAPAGTDVSSFGDPTLLRHGMPISSLTNIGNEFGAEFAKELATLPIGAWTGPIRSPFGLHLVRIAERRDEHIPPLAEIGKAVEQKWRTQKRDRFLQDEYDRLRAKYEVILPREGLAAVEGGAE